MNEIIKEIYIKILKCNYQVAMHNEKAVKGKVAIKIWHTDFFETGRIITLYPTLKARDFMINGYSI